MLEGHDFVPQSLFGAQSQDLVVQLLKRLKFRMQVGTAAKAQKPKMAWTLQGLWKWINEDTDGSSKRIERVRSNLTSDTG